MLFPAQFPLNHRIIDCQGLEGRGDGRQNVECAHKLHSPKISNDQKVISSSPLECLSKCTSIVQDSKAVFCPSLGRSPSPTWITNARSILKALQCHLS